MFHSLRILIAFVALLQAAAQVHAENFYRVELLLFERSGDSPEAISGSTSITLPDHGLPLWVNTHWRPETRAEATIADESLAIVQTPTIVTLPEKGLRLEAIANTLRRRQGYRVLAFTAWLNALPPGYRSVPLVVDLEIERPELRALRGTLTLERRRYLHLDADLHHLRALGPRFNIAPIPRQTLLLPGVLFSQSLGTVTVPAAPEKPRWSTETRLDELRRMRSGEIHYLDAPTMGLIAYFHRIERDPDSDQGSDPDAN